MAQYTHLPIYNKALAVMKEFYVRVPKFDKQYKYFLGGRLVEYSTEVTSLIIRSNNERDKWKRYLLLEKLCLTIEIMITHLRIANEMRQLGGQSSYLFLTEMMVELSKQAEGWKRYNSPE